MALKYTLIQAVYIFKKMITLNNCVFCKSYKFPVKDLYHNVDTLAIPELHIHQLLILFTNFYIINTNCLFQLFHYKQCCSFITALHVMQTRYSEENSVCLSVCLSVTRVYCDKTEERSVQIIISYQRIFILVFWEEEWLVGGNPFYLKFWVNRPPLARNRRFSTNNRS